VVVLLTYVLQNPVLRQKGSNVLPAEIILIFMPCKDRFNSFRISETSARRGNLWDHTVSHRQRPISGVNTVNKNVPRDSHWTSVCVRAVLCKPDLPSSSQGPVETHYLNGLDFIKLSLQERKTVFSAFGIFSTSFDISCSHVNVSQITNKHDYTALRPGRP
jgi:hypothetical protein